MFQVWALSSDMDASSFSFFVALWWSGFSSCLGQFMKANDHLSLTVSEVCVKCLMLSSLDNVPWTLSEPTVQFDPTK